MSIQLFSIIQFFACTSIFFVAYKLYSKNKKLGVCVALIVPMSFIFTPVVFKQESFSHIERFQESASEQELPDRVVVDKEGYSERDKQQAKQLKAESKELINEILN